MSDSTLLVKQLTAEDFSPERFVRDLTQQCVGGTDLRQHRQRIQRIAETTNSQLKQNVYRNYQQFINTAREIQYLEGEMYQLSHQLTEQRSLLTSLCPPPPAQAPPQSPAAAAAVDVPPAASRTTVPQADTAVKPMAADEVAQRRQQLLQVVDRVEGAGHVRDAPGRHLLHESDLIEMEVDSHAALRRLRGYLFNDGLMLAAWIPERRGHVRYRFETQLPLDGVALVNMRDVGALTNAFQLLLQPHARLFQCATPQVKKEWIEQVDAAKRSRLAVERREKTARQRRSAGESQLSSPDAGQHAAPAAQNDGAAAAAGQLQTDGVPVLVEDVEPLSDWLLDTPEELDVLLAQREFESALVLLNQAREHTAGLSASQQDSQACRRLVGELSARRLRLSEALLAELRVQAGRSLQGRSTRRLLQLLARLGSARAACHLLLERRSALLRHELRQLQLAAGSSQRLAALVLGAVAETARQLQHVLAAWPNCASALVEWAQREVAQLLTACSRQLLGGGSTPVSLAAVADGVTALRCEAGQLTACGLDLSHQLEAGVRRQAARALADARQQQVDAVRVRAAEERWRALPADRAAAELRALQLPAAAGQLTAGTLQFCRGFLQLVDEVCRLRGPGPRDCTAGAAELTLAAVLQAQLQQLQRALSRHDRQLVLHSADFLLDQLLREVESRFRQLCGCSCPQLAALRSQRKTFGLQ